MAISPVFIIRLKRMIDRLRDPYGLSDLEKIQLSEMLTIDEKIDVERRRQEQFHINSLMALSVGHYPNSEEMWWGDLHHPYGEAFRSAWREGPDVRRYTAKRWEQANRQIGIANGDRTKVASVIEWAERGDRHLQSLLDNIFKAYDALVGLPKLYLEHRGPRTWENLPRWVENIENVVWPHHPNSFRQAHIEVLMLKLERLITRVVV